AGARGVGKAKSGGSSESETSEATVNPAAFSPASTVTTATPAGTRRMTARSSSPLTTRAMIRRVTPGLGVRALAVAGANLVALGVHLLLERDVGRVLPVVRVEPGSLPHHVRRHAGPRSGDPVLLAGAGPALAVRGRARMGVAADPRVPGVEAVAEHPGRPVRDDRVPEQPARPVGRVVRVEEEQPAVAVGRRAHARRAEAADAL